jgi:hypothetical protein
VSVPPGGPTQEGARGFGATTAARTRARLKHRAEPSLSDALAERGADQREKDERDQEARCRAGSAPGRRAGAPRWPGNRWAAGRCPRTARCARARRRAGGGRGRRRHAACAGWSRRAGSGRARAVGRCREERAGGRARGGRATTGPPASAGWANPWARLRRGAARRPAPRRPATMELRRQGFPAPPAKPAAARPTSLRRRSPRESGSRMSRVASSLLLAGGTSVRAGRSHPCRALSHKARAAGQPLPTACVFPLLTIIRVRRSGRSGAVRAAVGRRSTGAPGACSRPPLGRSTVATGARRAASARPPR